MFDLEAEFHAWRRMMQKALRGRFDDLEELEGHLRDEVERLVQSGQAPERAWSTAVERLGCVEQLAAEFNKLPRRGVLAWWPARIVLGSYVLMVFVLANLFSPPLARETSSSLLAVHVALVSAGYAAVSAVGALAMWSVLARILLHWTADDSESLRRSARGLTVWGIATTLLGIGLGAVWSSGAFGRPWGWDSKEVGGLIVLTWQAFTCWLLSRPRHESAVIAAGLAGNVVVSFSWLGPPIFGAGLHAYGYHVSPLLIGFALLQAALLALALRAPRRGCAE